MKRPAAARWALAVVLAGNAVLWWDRGFARLAVGFDFDAFRADLERICAPVDLEYGTFDEDLLPESYLYAEARDESAPLFSIYLGYFPHDGAGAKRPHDPLVCYPAAGWDVLGPPVPLGLTHPETGASLEILLVSVARGERRLLVLFWRQELGLLPQPGGESEVAHLLRRAYTRRSDCAWVRVEFVSPPGMKVPGPAWKDRVAEIMVAAQDAFR